MSEWNNISKMHESLMAKVALATSQHIKLLGQSAAFTNLPEVIMAYDARRTAHEGDMLAAKIFETAKMPFTSEAEEQSLKLAPLVTEIAALAMFIEIREMAAEMPVSSPGYLDASAQAKALDEVVSKFEDTASSVWPKLSIKPYQIAPACGLVLIDHYGFKPTTAEMIVKLIDPLYGQRPAGRPAVTPGKPRSPQPR